MNTYLFPRKTIFGAGAAVKTPELIPAEGKVLIAVGSHAAKTPEFERLLTGLKTHTPELFTGIPAEPPLEAVDRMIETGRSIRANCIIAVGGGSVIDTAKAAAALIPLQGLTKEYFNGTRSIPGKGLFFAALPTTAGTGAESTNNSVLTDAKTKIKKSLRHPSMAADLAIVDPDFTRSCPPTLTAASGLDAFVQAFEAYTSPKASELSRALSSKAAVLILKNLRKACENPEDREVRSKMAEGSMISGMGFAQTGLGAVHGLAHPIGSLLKVPHGTACALLMPYLMRWNKPVCEKEYGELARCCGVGDTAEEFIVAAEELAESLGEPSNLKSYGFRREHFEFILRNCRSASMKQNPREMSDQDVSDLLEKLL